MNKPLALEMTHLSTQIMLGNMEGGSFNRDFEGKVKYYGMCRRKLWRRLSRVSICRGPLRNQEGSIYREL
jgi:hypothetical protein